jgi:hypothetical protein
VSLATLTDFIGIVEMVALSTPGFVAIINIGILFLRSKQGNKLEIESNSS